MVTRVQPFKSISTIFAGHRPAREPPTGRRLGSHPRSAEALRRTGEARPALSDHRVLICDDHWIVRQAIRARIDEIPGFEVVGEVENGAGVTAAVREHQPDLLLIDVES